MLISRRQEVAVSAIEEAAAADRARIACFMKHVMILVVMVGIVLLVSAQYVPWLLRFIGSILQFVALWLNRFGQTLQWVGGYVLFMSARMCATNPLPFCPAHPDRLPPALD